MKPEHKELIDTAIALIERNDGDKFDIIEVAEHMNVGVREAFHLVEALISSGYLQYHPAGGFVRTEKLAPSNAKHGSGG